jgi:hypothetical protein
MDQVPCAKCGALHDLSDLEPTFHAPDAYYEIPAEERAFRTQLGGDYCRLRDAADTKTREFLRALLPVPVRGEADPCCWGLWIELDAAAFRRAWDLWDDPEQDAEPPMPGTVANHIADYPETLGLPGTLQLTGPRTAPRFTLAPDLVHPLAREQRNGVHHERVLEWLDRQLHS